MDNVNLSDPILSRFDIVKVIKDRANEDLDGELSLFVINSHIKSHPYAQEYEQDLKTLVTSKKPK
jgi:DNA replication licensing factor MCM2